MTPTQYFTHGRAFTGGWEDYVVLAVIAFMAVLGILLYGERGKRELDRYSPRMAWLRAGLYSSGALVFSSTTGVFQTVAKSPLATAAQWSDPAWIAFTAFCFAVVAWSYGYWWPRGTLTHGRKLYVVPTLLFGLAWGSCEGLLYLSFYSVLEAFQFPRLLNAVLFVGLLSIYNINYQLGWWSIHVSPPHNIKATNMGKVMFAHNPFLIISLAYLLTYGNVGIYVILNACALAASAIAMRLPPFWADDGGKVSFETSMGE